MPVDEWSTGTSVAQEFPAQEPDVFRRLAQTLAANKREMFDIRASILARISDVVADLRAKDAALEALIGDQVRAGVGHADASGYGLTVARATLATATVAVPAGFTRALVYATAQVCGTNSTGVWDTLGGSPHIVGPTPFPGSEATISVSPGAEGSVTLASTALLTGVSGVIAVEAWGSTYGASWAAADWNTCNIDVMAVFLR